MVITKQSGNTSQLTKVQAAVSSGLIFLNRFEKPKAKLYSEGLYRMSSLQIILSKAGGMRKLHPVILIMTCELTGMSTTMIL